MNRFPFQFCLVIWAFTFSFSASANIDKDYLTDDPTAEVLIDHAVSDRKGPIEHFTDSMTGGSFVATPVRSSKKGFIIKTDELTVNYGYFPGEPKYQGAIVGVSLPWSWNKDYQKRSDELETIVKELDQEQPYIFVYRRRFPINVDVERTPWQILNVFPMQPEVAELLPKEFVVKGQADKKYPYEKGERTGKVIDVQRSGFLYTGCKITINAGGIKAGRVALYDYDMMTEKGCRFAESLMVSGVTVKLDFIVPMFYDLSHFLMLTPYRVNKFTIVDSEGLSSTQRGQSGGLSDEAELLLEILGIQDGASKKEIEKALEDYIQELVR